MAPDISPIQDAIRTWIAVGQALVGSLGALAFIAAFIYKMTAIQPRSVMQARQWIGRIVIGTVGVEMAGTLAQVLTNTVAHR
jgi:hypothetical protein